MKIKNICCIGAGYVGGPTMAVIALKCPNINVYVVDQNEEKIKSWNNKNLDKLPVFEPGLKDIIKSTRNKNLFFSSEIDEAINKSQMIFMAVNTPTKSSGEGKGYAADLTYIENCAKKIAEVAEDNKIIIEKSTLPVRTAEKIKYILDTNKKTNINFEVISNPEFLAEGTAIKDLFKSDRVLIGGDNTVSGRNAVKSLVKIYSNWIPVDRIITTNVWSSELSKLVSNAMLAQRLSSINSISALCEKTGADIEEVSKAVGLDHRIGSKFLKSSVGFGGSCFKKDILNLVYISRSLGLDKVADYWEKVIEINDYQTTRFSTKIISLLDSSIKNKVVCIFGWAFKKDTNDSRESASIYLAEKLLDKGAIINIYDPMVKKSRIISDLETLMTEKDTAIKSIKNNISRVNIFSDPYLAISTSFLIAICTEWDEFLEYNWKEIYKSMQKPAWVFDGRNLLNIEDLEEIGFNTYAIGKQ
jgi:UDPglucose 6-dehydrogenase